MFEWLVSNIGTIVIVTSLVVTAALIIGKMIRDKRNGRPTCGGNCSHCSMSDSCRYKKDK